jgi:DNA repair exonuclease SbcCD ATPase subunit
MSRETSDSAGDDVDARLAALEEDFDALATQALSAMQRVTELEAALEERDERIAELEADLEQLRERTDMLQQVRQNANRGPDERAAILIQTLYNEAHAHKDAGLDPRATMDKDAAIKALGGGIQRQKIYPTFRKAEALVDDTDVLEYVQVPRSAAENNHLELDLREGDVPAVVAGHSITKGGVATGD